MNSYSIYCYYLLANSIIIFSYFIKVKNESKYLALSLLLFINFLTENYETYLDEHGRKNYLVHSYFTLIQISTFIWFVSTFYKLKLQKKRLNYVNFIWVIITFINIYFIQGLRQFHTITYGIGSILLIASCIRYYVQLFQFPSEVRLLKQTEFWVITGIFFNFICGFPLFVLNNVYNNLVAQRLWPLIAVIMDYNNIIFCLLLTIGFLSSSPLLIKTTKNS